MSIRRIKHMFLRLSPEEKVIGTGGLLVIIGSFMPWFYIVLLDQSTVFNGFSGDLGIIGFVVFILVLLAILNLIGDHLHIKLPQFGYTKEQVLFFLMGQSAFLILLTIAIYTKKSLDYTTAELRFGIYFVLVGSFLGAFAAFAQIQKLKKKEVTEFFEHEEEIVETKHITSHKREIIEKEPEEEQVLFENEIEKPAIEEEFEEVIQENDMSDKINEVKDQSGYFTKEAGINNETNREIDDTEDALINEAKCVNEVIESEARPNETSENDKKTPGLSMNFYEDQ